MMNKQINKANILNYLKNKKDELHKQYGVTTLGLYGSYARDEATKESDIDIFYKQPNHSKSYSVRYLVYRSIFHLNISRILSNSFR